MDDDKLFEFGDIVRVKATDEVGPVTGIAGMITNVYTVELATGPAKFYADDLEYAYR